MSQTGLTRGKLPVARWISHMQLLGRWPSRVGTSFRSREEVSWLWYSWKCRPLTKSRNHPHGLRGADYNVVITPEEATRAKRSSVIQQIIFYGQIQEVSTSAAKEARVQQPGIVFNINQRWRNSLPYSTFLSAEPPEDDSAGEWVVTGPVETGTSPDSSSRVFLLVSGIKKEVPKPHSMNRAKICMM